MPRILGLSIGAALAAAIVLSSEEAATPERPAPLPALAEAERLFVSGHSLTAPLPPLIEALARARGRTLAVGSQLVDGSSIRMRLAAGAAAVPPAGTDVLLVTEQHRVLDAMSLEGTVAELRRLDEAFRAANPAGQTFFYLPWADVSDFDAPADWIRYERLAAPIWACAARDASGPRDMPAAHAIHLVPASLGLAALVEALAREPAAFPGFAGLSPREIGAALFTDAVHPTPLGGYFLASLTDATLFGAPPGEPPAPAGLDPVRASTVRAVALRFAADWRDTGGGAVRCRGGVGPGAVLAYVGYMAQAYGDPDAGFARRQLERLKHAARLLRQFSF